MLGGFLCTSGLAHFRGMNQGKLLLKPAETSELMTGIEDTQMALGSLLSNKYNAPFRAQIQKWVQRLALAQEVIELWLRVQYLWIYLEAVFSGGDIARQLPLEVRLAVLSVRLRFCMHAVPHADTRFLGQALCLH